MTVRRAWVQREVGRWIFFVPFCGSLILFLKWGIRYRIRDLKQLRAEFRELAEDGRPLLICSNHLTYLDPILLIYAFANHWWYLFHYRFLSWNLPAVEYKANPFYRLVCFAAKCLFIDRGGSRSHHLEVLSVARELLGRGEVVTLFPEGRRSTTGQFDGSKLAYGVGRIVSELRECRVLCVYLRADGAEGKTGFPPAGTTFRVMRELMIFRNTAEQAASRERASEITREIAERITRLEARYFAEAEPRAVPGIAAEAVNSTG